ncbi:glycosyltransferase family 4 protein [Vibrio minamisatsumaniensis]|uniref:glycosyltransferase family 4 protein n=1 Tax=Vibrio minamisatsumaniensis TaxID=2910243 RepID=UPI003D1AB1A8
MKLYYDITEILLWEGAHTGIQRVVNGYAEGLKKIMPNVVLFYIRDGKGYSLKTDKVLGFVCKDVIFTASANWDRIENLVFFERAKKSGAFCVNLYHDLTPIIIPHSFKPGFNERFGYWFDWAKEIFDFHIANSEHTKRDLLTYSATFNKDNVHVVRLADKIDTVKKFTLSEEKKFFSKFRLDKYLLSVGTIEFRKNHITLLNAYRVLVATAQINLPKLVLVGRYGWMNLDVKYQIENDPLLKDNVIVIEDATDLQLDCLYRNCLFTLYASIYEGWGLPIAESMNYGKPCIISDNTSLPEIAPNLTYAVNALDPYDWANKISMLCKDTSLYDENVTQIKLNYKSTNWTEASQQVLMLIQDWYSSVQEDPNNE